MSEEPEEVESRAWIDQYLDKRISNMGYVQRDEVISLIEEHSGEGGLSRDEILTLINENSSDGGLSEEEVLTLIEENTLSEADVRSIAESETFSERYIVELIEENTLSEDDVLTLIEENTLSEEVVQLMIDQSSLSEDDVRTLIEENTLSEDDVRTLINENTGDENPPDEDEDPSPARSIGPDTPSGDYHTTPGWGLVFENSQGVSLGETTLDALAPGTVNVELYTYEDGDIQDLVATTQLSVEGGVNAVNLGIDVQEPGTYLLTRDYTEQPEDNVSLRRMTDYDGWDDDSDPRFTLVRSGHPDHADNMNWYYFFGLTVYNL